MKVYIVILHFGDISITQACVLSLVKHEKDYAKIVIINNDSTIISLKGFPYKNIVIINNEKNLGFAAGVNVGIRYSLKQKADAVFLLNNDTYIKKTCMKYLLNEMKKDPAIGIIGPAISFEKNGKEIFDIGGNINRWTGRTHHTEVASTRGYSIRFVTYITGAAMLIKREVFKKIGLFDEQFFLYYEDADFCLRAEEQGFRIAVEPLALVYHLLSKTAGKMSDLSIRYQIKSAEIFGEKYFNYFPKNIVNKAFIVYQSLVFSIKRRKGFTFS